jgi:hypothetical protein
MSKVKEYAWSLHESGRCNRAECPFCTAPLPSGTHSHPFRPVQGGPPGTETGSNYVSRPERVSSPGMALAHAIKALREWDEPELAVMLTETVREHDPDLLSAAVAGWLS